ncbi:DUF6482 family protein [Thalassotalea marina]|uniref:Uncharacterized protein n=1 Tax=Thalassotalea marina TaxID=1673741 RepID=A0A919BGP7_9GAMM|nr:DUF6482 family protein [Thalassotalea marina]GHF89871.1 hypothetical protein GCM10017161_17280 [Thalassotalea marina]
MQQDTLINLCKLNHLTPMIINTADSPHYLVGAKDADGNFFSITEENATNVRLGSLEQAKQWFIDMGIYQAEFEMQTAYDEMVGINEPSKVKQWLTFGHL